MGNTAELSYGEGGGKSTGPPVAWVVPSWFSARDLPLHGELDPPDGLYLVVTPTVSPAGLMPSSQHQSVAPNPLLPANCGCM